MDEDTIFTALSDGERIVHKFQSDTSCNDGKSVAIVTTHRLLTRTKQRTCCCLHRSSYSAIALESIYRIDDDSARRRWFLCAIVWIFWILVAAAGIVASILWLLSKSSTRTIGIIVMVVSPIPLLLTILLTCIRICCCKTKTVGLHGTFGSMTMVFSKEAARLFESILSEQISKIKLRLQQPQLSAPYYLPDQTQVKPYELMVASSRF